MFHLYFILSLIYIVVADPSNTILRHVSVNNSAVLFSYGYPAQLVTTNGINPPNLDWNLTSSNGKNLLFLFDRLDIPYNDIVLICSQKAYADCAKRNSLYVQCDCSLIQSMTSSQAPIEWNYYWGPPVLMFRPEVPVDNTALGRNGYRVTVREVDPMNRRFFHCNTTIDIRDSFTPTFLVSEGFPSMTTQFSLCQVKFTSSSGIRIRVPIYSLKPYDTLSFSGDSPNGGKINWKPSGDYNTETIETSYYLQTVTVTIHMTQGDIISSNMFVIIAEKYDVTPSICDIYDNEFTNSEFSIRTTGFTSQKNYINNLNCTYTLDGLPPNSQLLLQIYSLDLENGADYVAAPEFTNLQWTDSFRNLVFPSAVNISQTTVTIVTDGLEGRSGISAYMHILDCTCPGGNFSLVDGKPLSTAYPNPNFEDNTDTYCKGVSCAWTYNIDRPNRLILLNVTKFDVFYMDNPIIYVDGQESDSMAGVGPLSYFNVRKIEVRFTADSFPKPENAFHKGFEFNIQYGKAKVEEVDISNSSIYYFDSFVQSLREIHVTSRKGRLALQVLSIFDDSSLEIFDGSFENGTKMTLSNQIMVASGRELSIRTSQEEGTEQPDQFVISDSFTTPDGTVCGGTSSTSLSTVEGCLSCFTGVIAQLQVNGPPCPVYKSFSIDEKELIATSDTVPLDIYTSSAMFMFTFKIPANYTGGSYNAVPFAETIDLSNGTVLLANIDFLGGICHDFCGFEQEFAYYGPGKKMARFELLESIGNATLQLDGKRYSGKDGLLNITIPFGSFIDFEQSAKGDQLLFARATPVDAPITSTSATPENL